MKTKQEIRTENKNLRKNIDISAVSKEILSKLFALKDFTEATNVYTYISKDDEVNTFEILNCKNKNIFVPKISGKEMFFTKYEPNNLVKNKFGVYEPSETKVIMPKENDVIIIPALASDKNFNRIGYGGGYYDRFLQNAKGIKIILLPDNFLYEKIPADDFDVRSDIIITDKQILRKIS